MKYYARHSFIGEYKIYSEKSLKEEIQANIENGQSYLNNELENLHEFNSFREAKQNILEGIECDLFDLKRAKDRVKKLRKADLT